MWKKDLLIFIVLLLLATVVLLISLQSANSRQTSNAPQLRSHKLYVAAEILPDHAFYPLLMIYDRLRLQLANQQTRVDLLLSYAQRRDYYAHRLLQQNKVALATTTFAKAVTYLNQALVDPAARTQQAALLRAHHEQLQWWLEIRDLLAEQDKIMLEDLFAVREQLLRQF